MKTRIIKPLIFIAFSITAMACQNQQTNNIEDTQESTSEVSTLPSLPIPCKNFTSPPVKDKSKIKEMLLKEGKINNGMTEEEINQYLSDFIKKKSSKTCKPSSKQGAFTPLLEKTHYA